MIQLKKVNARNPKTFFVYNNIYVLHQNIAGILNKAEALTICLEELTDKNIQVEVLCITEHFMMAGYESHLLIPNYTLAAYYSRTNNKRGGACILVKNGNRWREIPEIKKLSISGLCEFCAIELLSNKVVIVCIYRVPKQENLNTFFSKLEIILQLLNKKSYKHVVIAGDFNIDILKQNNVTLDFENLLLNYNMTLALKEPTRLISSSCIDNFAHNFPKPCKTEVLELALSDHTAQLIRFRIKQSSIKVWRRRNRDFSKENIQKFKDCLSQLSFSDLYEELDPNKAYNCFMETFKLFYDLCFPFKISTIRVNRKTKWISRGLKMCSAKKKQLLWNFRLKSTSQNKYVYRTYTKTFKKIINLTQRAQNNYRIKNSVNKAKTTWDIINRAKLNIPRDSITRIKVDNHIITNPAEIANAFNNYFVDKIEPISSRGNNVTLNLPCSNSSIFMTACIPNDIQKIINGLKNTNSVGLDDISTKIIKSVNVLISDHLSYILNLCISNGVFPDNLKSTIIKPIFKKGDKEFIEFYRPIALIPIISKIFEKYIHSKLYNYLEINKFLCSEQKGFRQNKDINLAIYDFYKSIITCVDKRCSICAIYCDMTQAFDYVDHEILLNKLESYGIRGNVLSLIKSYLTNRNQITGISKINILTKYEETHLSETRLVKYGVPQGSVLGPLLFIIYINDLPKCTIHPMSLFADDSTVSIQCTTREKYEEEINESLASIVNWLDNNNLKINLTKTQIMHFSQRPQLHKQINVGHKNNPIREVASTKFLGLTMDRQLNWKDHIEGLCKKVSSSAYALYKLTSVVNIDAVLTSYHSLTASVLRYGIIFWGNSTNSIMVFKAQKRCVRSMFGLQSTDSCKPYFLKHKILTLPSLYILEVSLFVHKNPQLFQRMCDVVKRNRRNNNRLCLHSAKTTLMTKSLLCMAPKIYNKLPQEIKTYDLTTFKRALRALLVKKCYYTINDFLNDNNLEAS